MKPKRIYEVIEFKRGKEPKRAIKVGQSAIYPDLELFEKIHDFWENVDNWPIEFRSVTPINWNSKIPNFVVNLSAWSGETSKYFFYLLKEGITAFYTYFTDAGGGRRRYEKDEYKIETYEQFIRILESNHTQNFNLGESLDFERGKDPRHSMDIGQKANPIEIEFIEKLMDDGSGNFHPIDMYPDDVWRLFHYWSTVSPEEKNNLVIFGLPGDAEHDGVSIKALDNKWVKYRGHKYFLNTKGPKTYESLEFERGQDPKTSMGVGVTHNALIIVLMEIEYCTKKMYGEEKIVPVESYQDYVNAGENTWYEDINDDDYVHYVLSNWKEEADYSMNFEARYPDDEEDDMELWHAPELEDRWVVYQGQSYYIPKTNKLE